MENDKRKGGEYNEYPPPETKLGKPQPSKQFYCYSSWTFPSRRFLSRGKDSLGLGLPIVPGAMAGFGGMGLWRPFLTGLPELFCCGGIDVRIVD
ncbi:MAG TPA: hypothetical protein VGB21_02225 [Candidatus Methylomirabilis sp.]|jgi:hypothetical protein